MGEDVSNIFSKLIEAAKENAALTSVGVVILDEFDKIAGRTSSLKFAEEETTKDVSGYGVQRELLKLIEPESIYRLDDPFLDCPFNNLNVLFIGSGTFSGIAEIGNEVDVGFLKERKERKNKKISYDLEDGMAVDVSRFYKYGFLPELIARFQRIIPFKPLDKETLKSILNLKLKEIKNEYLIEGFKLIISNKAKDFENSDFIKNWSEAIKSQLFYGINYIYQFSWDPVFFWIFKSKKKCNDDDLKKICKFLVSTIAFNYFKVFREEYARLAFLTVFENSIGENKNFPEENLIEKFKETWEEAKKEIFFFLIVKKKKITQ